MSSRLPERIDVLEFAEKGRSVEGCLPLASMERVRSELFDPSGTARFVLRFDKEGSTRRVRGRVTAQLVLQCQPCLGGLDYGIESDISIAFVRSVDEANLLPDEYEPSLLGEEPLLSVSDLIEDEIVLALPTVPRHSVCEPAGRIRADNAPVSEETKRPFADLAKLFPSDTKRN
jgi:uncharacterized protein